MRNAGLDEAQAGIKIAMKNINNLRYADDTTLMAESKELKSLLMKGKKSTMSLLPLAAHGGVLLQNIASEKYQALSLWSGSNDSKTLDYQRTNPREYQIVRTHRKETT